jgi:mono/diheme cytochrome c family protein
MRLKIGVFSIVMCGAIGVACAAPRVLAQDAPPAPATPAPPAPEAPAAAAAAPAGKKTTWDGIYTKEQADKGEKLYTELCLKCHGAEAVGADAPGLAGGQFASDWDMLTVNQLFDRVRNTMPQDDPQTLSREDTAAVLAYMFVKNNFPPGDAPLPSAGDALSQITYVSNKP